MIPLPQEFTVETINMITAHAKKLFFTAFDGEGFIYCTRPEGM